MNYLRQFSPVILPLYYVKFPGSAMATRKLVENGERMQFCVEVCLLIISTKRLDSSQSCLLGKWLTKIETCEQGNKYFPLLVSSKLLHKVRLNQFDCSGFPRIQMHFI